MEAKELMIGDWVYMRLQGAEKYYEDRVCSLSDASFLDYIPIPLTAEILEKNGLDKVPELSMVLNRDTMPMYHSPMLYYVHELQHALRLCGLNELADNLKV